MKSHDEVSQQYRDAASPEAWLESEIGEFFSADLSGTSAAEAFHDALSHGSNQADSFLSSRKGSRDLSSCILAVRREGDSFGSYHSALPSPVSLLLILAASCKEHDDVMLIQRYFSGVEKVYTSPWPFGMDVAVEMTTPPRFEDDDTDSSTTEDAPEAFAESEDSLPSPRVPPSMALLAPLAFLAGYLLRRHL